MKEAYKGSDIVRWLVIVADFIILNFVLFLAINWDKILSLIHISEPTRRTD